jgi:hypothetical protein
MHPFVTTAIPLTHLRTVSPVDLYTALLRRVDRVELETPQGDQDGRPSARYGSLRFPVTCLTEYSSS